MRYYNNNMIFSNVKKVLSISTMLRAINGCYQFPEYEIILFFGENLRLCPWFLALASSN